MSRPNPVLSSNPFLEAYADAAAPPANATWGPNRGPKAMYSKPIADPVARAMGKAKNINTPVNPKALLPPIAAPKKPPASAAIAPKRVMFSTNCAAKSGVIYIPNFRARPRWQAAIIYFQRAVSVPVRCTICPDSAAHESALR